MKTSVIITSYKEPRQIKRAINAIINNYNDIEKDIELIVISPDQETRDAANECIKKSNLKRAKVLQDELKGKPAALNIAFKESKGEFLVLTDGDMFIEEQSIKRLIEHMQTPKVAGVSGRVESLEPRTNMFGFYSHLFCSAADYKRQHDKRTHMSGYLYAIRKEALLNIFPIPEELRSEDAYISAKLLESGWQLEYEPRAIAYVRFPKNTKDWLNQKIRSVGGTTQLKKYIKPTKNNRSITQDLQMFLYPVKYAKTLKEYFYLLYLYPLRLYLWIIVFYRNYITGFEKGPWQRIESTKIL